MEPIIEAKNIAKVFFDPHRVAIFKDLSLSIYPGDRLAILGKSGEGKTTLLHVLATIDEPTSGEILYFGKKATNADKNHIRNRHFGFVFQAFHLMQDMSALDNVLLNASIGRKSISKNSPAYNRACELLHRVGLGDRIHFAAKKLSGGERQRLSLARALINDPDVLFADEPTGNLDHATAQEIHTLLLSVADEFKKALILVTHNENLAKLMTSCYELENCILTKK